MVEILRLTCKTPVFAVNKWLHIEIDATEEVVAFFNWDDSLNEDTRNTKETLIDFVGMLCIYSSFIVV